MFVRLCLSNSKVHSRKEQNLLLSSVRSSSFYAASSVDGDAKGRSLSLLSINTTACRPVCDYDSLWCLYGKVLPIKKEHADSNQYISTRNISQQLRTFQTPPNILNVALLMQLCPTLLWTVQKNWIRHSFWRREEKTDVEGSANGTRWPRGFDLSFSNLAD